MARREKYGDHPKACEVDKMEREDVRITATEISLRMELKEKEVEDERKTAVIQDAGRQISELAGDIYRVRMGETKLTAQRDEAKAEVTSLNRTLETALNNFDIANNQMHVLRSGIDDLRVARDELIKELTEERHKWDRATDKEVLVHALLYSNIRGALDEIPTKKLADIARAVHGRIYKRLEG